LENNVPIVKKKDKSYIFHLLGILLPVNPKIALYAWFKLLYPTLIQGSHKKVEDDIITYIDLAVKDKKTFTAVEVSDDFNIDEQVIELLDFLFNSPKSGKFRDRFANIVKDLMNCTVFRSSKTPRLFFKDLMKLGTKILSKPARNEKEMNFILNTLAVCLLKDSECHTVLIDNYHKLLSESSAVLIHLGTNWEKFTGKLNTSQEALQSLVNTCKTLITVNQQIIQGKLVKNGKNVVPKTVGLKVDELSKITQSYQSILKTFQSANKPVAVKASGKKGGFCTLLLFLFLIFATLFLAIYFEIIPAKYTSKITSNIPNEIKTIFNRLKNFN